MTPVLSMSSKISSSALPAESGGRRGDCLIGGESPVSTSCSRTGQNPRSVESLAKVVARRRNIALTYTFETYSVFARLLVAAVSSYGVHPQLTLMDVRARSAVVLMLVDDQTY